MPASLCASGYLVQEAALSAWIGIHAQDIYTVEAGRYTALKSLRGISNSFGRFPFAAAVPSRSQGPERRREKRRTTRPNNLRLPIYKLHGRNISSSGGMYKRSKAGGEEDKGRERLRRHGPHT